MKFLKTTAKTLLIVGALNWGLALFNINLVTAVLGTMPMLVKVVYALVGLSGLYAIYDWAK